VVCRCFQIIETHSNMDYQEFWNKILKIIELTLTTRAEDLLRAVFIHHATKFIHVTTQGVTRVCSMFVTHFFDMCICCTICYWVILDIIGSKIKLGKNEEVIKLITHWKLPLTNDCQDPPQKGTSIVPCPKVTIVPFLDSKWLWNHLQVTTCKLTFVQLVVWIQTQ
jgi:hypothetical protein